MVTYDVNDGRGARTMDGILLSRALGFRRTNIDRAFRPPLRAAGIPSYDPYWACIAKPAASMRSRHSGNYLQSMKAFSA